MNKLTKIIRLNLKYVLLFVWMVVIFLLSNEVSSVSSGRSGLVVGFVTSCFHLDMNGEIMTFVVRKSAHIIAYFILGILLFNVIVDYKFDMKFKFLLSAGLAFTYACSDEFHQLFVSGRSCEIRDVMIDTVASIVGISLCYILCKWCLSCFYSKKDV